MPQGPSVRIAASSAEGGDDNVDSVDNPFPLARCASRSSRIRASNAWRIARLEGETTDPEATFGVDGRVASELTPKRHGRPTHPTESRSRRKADREMPGGDWSSMTEPAVGVAGTVSSRVIPKRQRLPTEVLLPHSVPDELDEVPSSHEVA